MHARQEVRVRGLLEKELLNAAEAILQEPYQQTVVRDIKKMVVGNDSIQFRLNRFNMEPVVAVRKRRVAGYARVSTDRDEQATSYEAQMAYYKSYIYYFYYKRAASI